MHYEPMQGQALSIARMKRLELFSDHELKLLLYNSLPNENKI